MKVAEIGRIGPQGFASAPVQEAAIGRHKHEDEKRTEQKDRCAA
jgi:hypothetical protein